MSLLTTLTVRDLKQRLWFGESADALAIAFAVTPGMIRHIRSGRHWPSVPWPDASTGALPTERQRTIERERKNAMRELQAAAQEELQRTIKRRLRRA